MKNLTKTTKLMLTLIVTVAFFTIFSAKTDAATIEKIVFDNRYYIASNLDLEKFYGFNDYAGAYEHFNYHGINEGRAGSPLFDVEYYKEANPDLSGMTNEDAYEHFIYHGIAEGRTASELFNVKYYLDTYPDVKEYCTNEDGEVDYAKAYDHYIYSGIVEGRSPNANLDVDHYIYANTDLKEEFVKEDGIDYVGAAEHYFFHGFSEERETTHKYDKQTMKDNGDGTHSLVCDVCGLTSEVKEPHEMGDYEITDTTHKKHCTKCDFCEEAEHNFTYGYDEENDTYTKTCKDCNFTGTDETKQALTDAKVAAEAKIDEFVGTLDTTDYSAENMQTLLKTINEASNKLHDATTPKEAAQVAEDVIAELDAIETLTDKAIAEASSELSEFVENGALKKTVPGSDMDYAAVLSDTIAEAYNKVNGAESVEAAGAKLEEAKNDILNALKEQVKFYLDTLYNNGEAYQDMVLTEAKYQAYLTGINEAETIKDAIDAYENAERERYSLSEKISEQVNKLTEFVENSD